MTSPAVQHPDTVTSVIAYLTPLAAPAPVVSKVPNPRPGEFVLVRRTGGPEATRVTDLPQITIETWSTSDVLADLLAQRCRRWLREMADGTDRGGVIVYRYQEFAGPGYLPDPDSEQDRYTFTVSLHTRTTPT